MKRLHLISGPRNLSTALMYSFAQRKDTVVVDEPFYAFYLHKSGAAHPGKNEVMKSQPVNESDVMQLILDPWLAPNLFIKNMAHHLALMSPEILSSINEFYNIFLIRNPKDILISYAQVIDTPTMQDIGIEFQYFLFTELQKLNPPLIVIDASLLLANPESVLKQLCKKVNIPFMDDMLHWHPGPKPYDGIWAKYWYKNVHLSKGFQKQPTTNTQLPDRLLPLYDKSLYYYEKLLPFSINP